MTWNVLRVKTGADLKVLEAIVARQIKAVRVTYAHHHIHHRSKKQLVSVRALYPGYLFVEVRSYPLQPREIPGAISFITYPDTDKFAVVSNDQLETSWSKAVRQSRLSEAEFVVPFVKGQKVYVDLFGNKFFATVNKIVGVLVDLVGHNNGKRFKMQVPHTVCFGV